MTCRTCGESKRHGGTARFCVLYGIIIRADHPGCKYYIKGGKTNERTDEERCEGQAEGPGSGQDQPEDECHRVRAWEYAELAAGADR